MFSTNGIVLCKTHSTLLLNLSQHLRWKECPESCVLDRALSGRDSFFHRAWTLQTACVCATGRQPTLTSKASRVQKGSDSQWGDSAWLCVQSAS